MQSLRSFRVILAISAAVDVSFGYTFAFAPSLVERLYGFSLSDDLHAYLSLSRGAFFFLLALASLFSFLRPRGLKLFSLLLAAGYMLLFLVDVVVLARNMMEISNIVPEMTFFLVMSGLIVRFYPGKEEVKVFV